MIKEVSFKKLNRPPAFGPGVVYCPYIPVMLQKNKLTVTIPIVDDRMNIKEAIPFKSETLKLRVS